MLRTTAEVERFRKSAALVAALQPLLADPTMVKALEAVASIAQPRSVPPFTPGTPHDTTIAHSFCEMAGVNTALIYLRSLAYQIDDTAPSDEMAAEEEEYSHTLPELLRERPKKQ
jgi:hypothetical protein